MFGYLLTLGKHPVYLATFREYYLQKASHCYISNPYVERDLSSITPKSVFDKYSLKLLSKGKTNDRDLIDTFKANAFTEADNSQYDEDHFDRTDFQILSWRMMEKYFQVNIIHRMLIRDFLVDWLRVTLKETLDED